ncbi:calcium-binding protein P-like, partial [Teleopsis dalmanni]|uniref:calcium-binding protein P-like n=1 Tax=Teleopsis dalmanni TaxID=139649 RepID=UPI0018CF5B75
MKHNKLYCVLFALCLVTHSIVLASASRTKGSNRKTSSNSHVTRPTHSTNTGNSHSDLAKLSYSNYNSQPNRPANTGTASHTPAPIGWNVPNKQGPPPAYSANNPVGGAKTNIHEAPPNYGASGTNVHTPITATNAHSVQSSYPGQHGASYPVQQGATYHSPGSLPPGATYYPGGHVPQGVPAGYPAGSAYPGGHMPVGGGSYYPAGGHVPQGATYYPAGGVPAGATYIPAGASLPPGATYYPQQPQSSSSGLGFGSGLAAGAIGGAILGHVLTPTETRVVEHAPAQSGSAGGDSKIII